MPTFSGIHHMALTVSDLEVSVPFYETLTGESLVRRISRPAPVLTIGLTQR